MINVLSGDLKRVLTQMQHFIAIKSLLPANGMVRIKLLDRKHLEFSVVSDLASIRAILTPSTIASNVFDLVAPFDVVAPFNILASTVKALDYDLIDLTQGFSALKIKTDTGHYKMTGVSEKDFPEFPKAEGDAKDVKLMDLARALARVEYSIGRDELRPAMCSVLLEKQADGMVNTVSTDSHRISIYSADLPFVDSKLLLHFSAVKTIIYMSSFVNDAKVVIGERYASFKTDEIEFIVTVVNEEFPEYKGVLPNFEDPTIITIDKNACASSIKRAELYSNKSSSAVGLKVESQTLTVLAFDGDYDQSFKEKMSVGQTGKDGLIAFNGAYLREMISKVETDTAQLHFHNERTGAIIKSDADPKYYSLLMPVQADFQGVN